ncbi:MAG: acyclic terpene utilization AtuA family protein [Promethearchaeota archaeon]|jgi:hypothetical protein
MDEMRILAASGMLGTGFLESSLNRAIEKGVEFIGCDSGSTDSGPTILGSGDPHVPKETIKRDFKLMLIAARKENIPLIIGSAGRAGAEPHLQWFLKIVREVIDETNLKFKMAVIHSEQNKDFLKRKLVEGKIEPLNPYEFKDFTPDLTEEVIDKCSHIVGVMGAEPYMKALEQGAEVIIAGRSTDTAIYSTIPIMRGFPPGLAWHAAKIIECGAASVEARSHQDCMTAIIRKDHFIIEPANPDMRCTTASVIAHNLYENPSPYHMYEPSGLLDTSKAKYEQYDDRSVKVSGSKFIHKEYTVKLEGVGKVGYRNILISGIRDPVLIRDIDFFLEQCRKEAVRRINDVSSGQITPDSYTINYTIYGRNGVMGPLEPVQDAKPHELCVLSDVVAKTQDQADSIIYQLYRELLHQPVRGWKAFTSNIAVPPFCTPGVPTGPVYKFFLNHRVKPDTPTEMFPMEIIDI